MRGGAQGFPARWDTTPTQGSSSMIHRLKSCGALVCNDQLFTREGCDTAEVFGCRKCFTSGRNVFKGEPPPPPNQTPQKPPHATTWDRLSFRPRRGPAERGLCVSGHRPLVSEEESRPSPARPQGCPGMLQKRQRCAQKGAQGGIAAGELR